ncbi:hypothetical protein PDIDSM_527 [Penicillium digitatum]|nr:hypothetical protein PDIDSM_527 [Penicillium digitatum]
MERFDLIGLLPTTPSGNRWIITAIDYARGWPLAKALPDATEEAFAEILHEDIFTVYGAPAEFLTDNGANLLATSVQYFIKLINAKHRTTTPYHPRTNGKVENFNGLLGRMLTKYCMGKPTRVWTYTWPKPCSPQGSGNMQRDTELVTSIRGPAELDNKIMAVNHARAEANEALLHKAIRAQKIQDEKVTTCSLQPGKWGIGPQRSKAEVRVAMVRTVQDPKSTPLGTNLVNGRRLVDAFVENPNQLWSSSGGKYQLRRKGLDIRHPLDGGEIIDTDSETPPSYHELATISRAEWDAMERSGVRSRLVGREEVLRHVVTKTRKQPSATKKGENMVPAPEAEEAPGTGFTPTEQVEESQPRDWNPAHEADERTEEAPGMGFTPTEQVEESQPRPGASFVLSSAFEARDWNPAHEAEEKTQEENFCQQQWPDEPTQGRVEEIHDMDLDDVGEPEEGGQGDQQMEDAPPAHQTSPYLFRKPRRCQGAGWQDGMIGDDW